MNVINTNGRWFRATLCGAILSAVALSQLFGAEALVQASSPTQNPEREVPIDWLVLTGVIHSGKSPWAFISSTIKGHGGWCATGDLAFGYTIKEITLNCVVFVRRGSNEELRLNLSRTSYIEGKAGPELYTKAWINSRANPMLNTFREFPMMRHDWSTFTDAEKEQIMDFYGKHGWKMVQAVTTGNSTEFTWSNIYTEERTAAIKANREKFGQTLSPDQLVLWNKIQNSRDIYPDESGKFTEAQRAEIAALHSIHVQLNASLTAEQKSALIEIFDFTKADWK